MVIWNTMEEGMSSNHAAPPAYLQQLMSIHQTEQASLLLKSEDSHDSTSSVVSFLNGDCAFYGQEHSSPQTHYNHIQAITGYTNGCSMFGNVTCAQPNVSNISTMERSLPSCPGANNFSHNHHLGLHGHTGPMQTNMDLPDTTNFPGDYNFELYLGPHTDSATKSADFTFSTALKKLYVQRASQCPFMFKTGSRPPANSYVKILPVFKGTHVLSEPVRRCSNHAEGEEEGSPRYHFIRASNRQSHYNHSDDGRLFVTMPYSGPQVGAEYQVELLSFMCFNSCGHSSHSKRRIDVIFILECNGQILGRQVIEVRVCACPGRDRSNEESVSPKSSLTKRNRTVNVRKIEKRRKLSSNTGDQDFIITTNNPVFYQILRQILVTLETQLPQADTSLADSISPNSSISSPGNVFKHLQEMENTDDEVMG